MPVRPDRPVPPPTQCGGTPDGHVHYVTDTDGGTALVCCYDSEPTYPLAYQQGRTARYLDKPDVEQCPSTARLTLAASTHRTTAHPQVVTPSVR